MGSFFKRCILIHNFVYLFIRAREKRTFAYLENVSKIDTYIPLASDDIGAAHDADIWMKVCCKF